MSMQEDRKTIFKSIAKSSQDDRTPESNKQGAEILNVLFLLAIGTLIVLTTPIAVWARDAFLSYCYGFYDLLDKPIMSFSIFNILSLTWRAGVGIFLFQIGKMLMRSTFNKKGHDEEY